MFILEVLDEALPRLVPPAGAELVASGPTFRLARLTPVQTEVAER